MYPDIILIWFIIADFFFCWAVGANNVANSMATSYGSQALTLRQVILIGCSIEFFGALFFGGKTPGNIASLIPVEIVDHCLIILGFIAVLLSTGVWMAISTYYHLPVSATHSIIGAVFGLSLAMASQGYIEIHQIKWDNLVGVAVGLVLSPIIGAILAVLISTFIRLRILKNHSISKPHQINKPIK